MEQALIVLSFVAMVVAPCVIASRTDLDAEEARANRSEMESRFSSRESRSVDRA
jgi:hypothetical protein